MNPFKVRLWILICAISCIATYGCGSEKGSPVSQEKERAAPSKKAGGGETLPIKPQHAPVQPFVAVPPPPGYPTQPPVARPPPPDFPTRPPVAVVSATRLSYSAAGGVAAATRLSYSAAGGVASASEYASATRVTSSDGCCAPSGNGRDISCHADRHGARHQELRRGNSRKRPGSIMICQTEQGKIKISIMHAPLARS